MNDTSAPVTESVGQVFLGAIRGDRQQLKWLEQQRPCLAAFVRALDGGPAAREKLRELNPDQWEALFAVISDDEVYRQLEKRQPDVAALIDAVRGDDEMLDHLRRQKPSFAKLATLIREANEATVEESNGGPDENLAGSAVADVGCLIGEMHLERHEYHRAVEAFTRAIENEPTADAYEGRSQAYQALALLDEKQALAMRAENL